MASWTPIHVAVKCEIKWRVSVHLVGLIQWLTELPCSQTHAVRNLIYYLRPILILSSILHPIILSCLFPSCSSTKILCEFLFCPTRATLPAHLIYRALITLPLVISTNREAPRYEIFTSFLLLSGCYIFEHIQPVFFPQWRWTSVTSTLTRMLAPSVGLVWNKWNKCSEKSPPFLPECNKQLHRIGIWRERERRTLGTGVFRLPATFLWLGSWNCGWRQSRTRRSLLRPMFRRQLCS